jgi:hypothetical protein
MKVQKQLFNQELNLKVITYHNLIGNYGLTRGSVINSQSPFEVVLDQVIIKNNFSINGILSADGGCTIKVKSCQITDNFAMLGILQISNDSNFLVEDGTFSSNYSLKSKSYFQLTL